MVLLSFAFLLPIASFLLAEEPVDRHAAVFWAEECFAQAPLIIEMKRSAGTDFDAKAWNQACLKLQEPCETVLQTSQERNAVERCRQLCSQNPPKSKKGKKITPYPDNPCLDNTIFPPAPQQDLVNPDELNLEYLTIKRINRIVYYAARDPDMTLNYQYAIDGDDPFSRHHHVACHAWTLAKEERDDGDSYERALRNAEYYLYSYCETGENLKGVEFYWECEKAYVYDLVKYSDWFRDSDWVSTPGKTPPAKDAVDWACIGTGRAADDQPPEFDRKPKQ